MYEHIPETWWYIWSNEHHAFWKPDSQGYTIKKEEAGKYSFTEAARICRNANIAPEAQTIPQETMVQVY